MDSYSSCLRPSILHMFLIQYKVPYNRYNFRTKGRRLQIILKILGQWTKICHLPSHDLKVEGEGSVRQSLGQSNPKNWHFWHYNQNSEVFCHQIFGSHMSLARVPDVQGPICPAGSQMSSARVPDVFGLVPNVQGPRCLGPICPATHQTTLSRPNKFSSKSFSSLCSLAKNNYFARKFFRKIDFFNSKINLFKLTTEK